MSSLLYPCGTAIQRENLLYLPGQIQEEKKLRQNLKMLSTIEIDRFKQFILAFS